MNKRNANGAGTIRHRSDGRWEGRFSYGFNPATGEHIQKSVYGKTQKEVRQKLAEITAELDKGAYMEPSKMRLSEWLEVWLAEYTSHVKPNTVRAYQDRVHLHINKALGATRLSELSAIDVQKFINSLSKDTETRKALSPKTVKNVHGVLHIALKQAVILGYIRANPADNCKLPRLLKSEIKPLDSSDTARFLEAAANDPYYPIFLIDIFTGLRQGEILGLKWSDFDFATNTLTVRQQLQKEKKANGKYYLASLKNDKTRTIRVAKTVADALRERKREQAKNKLAVGSLWDDTFPNLVFTNEFGACLSSTTVRKHFKEIVASIGLPEARFHDLRHSYAVASLQNGDDPKTVQENLGHYSASFTLDVYGHVTDEMKDRSAERMESYIKRITG